jgi:hypothetical protein
MPGVVLVQVSTPIAQRPCYLDGRGRLVEDRLDAAMFFSADHARRVAEGWALDRPHTQIEIVAL